MAIEYANSDPIKVTHTKGAMSDGQKYTNTLPWKVELTNDDLAYQEDIQNLQRQINALEADLTWRDPVETYEDLPASGNDDGDVRLVTSTGVLYVWAGSEWVALNESQDPIKELTAADKNYPIGNPTGIAWWLLPAGTYHITDNTPFYYEKGSAGAVKYFTVLGEIDGSRICFEDGSAMRDYNVRSSVHIGWYKRYNADPEIWQVPKTTIVDNLTSTSTTSALSANQGKVLKDLADGNVGKAKVLTTADYNWNNITSTTEDPNSIALWLLPPGVYQTSRMNVQATKSEGIGTGSSDLWVVTKADNTAVSLRIPIADPRYNQLTLYICNATTGQKGDGSNTGIMRTSDIVDGLTSTAADKVLSAKQGKVLNDKIDGLIIAHTGAPTSSTSGTKGIIWEDTTNGKLYFYQGFDTSGHIWVEVADANKIPTTLTDAQYAALWSMGNPLNDMLETIVSGSGV